MEHIDRKTLVQRIVLCAMQRGNILIPPCPLEPKPTDYLSVYEGIFFGFQLYLLVLRGASVDDCTAYVATRDTELPFEGCEQTIFDTLLAAVTERADIDNYATTLVHSVSSRISRAFDIIEQDTGIARTSILSTLTTEPAHA